MLPRLLRGCLSSLGVLVHPVGRFCRSVSRLASADRYERGLAIVLPGVEGKSYINIGAAEGLADAGFEGAIEIFDWTTGIILLFPYHLRSLRRNERQADRLARRIAEYRASYPGRPVHLVGHSGGAGIALLALERLPADCPVTSAVLLLPAVSPAYNLAPALARVDREIRNFWSPLDLFFLGLGTCLLGTLDGRHTISAGARGFQIPPATSVADRALYESRLTQVAFHPRMVRAFNFGGHMGMTNRVFVAERVAPVLADRRAW